MNWLIYLIIYLLLGCLTVYIGSLIAPQRHRGRILYLFLAACVIFIPIAGLAVAIFFSLIIRYTTEAAGHILTQTADIPYFRQEKLIKGSQFGEGGIKKLLIDCNSRLSKRMDSLISLNHMMSAEINRINHELMRDKSDEIRLFAYSQLEKKETETSDLIQQLLTTLEKVNNDMDKATIYTWLATCYWDLVYLNLASPDIKKIIIEKAHQCAKQALNFKPNQIALHLLLGKIHFYQNEWNKAETYFEHAMTLNAPLVKIIPFLAEIYFNQGNYQKVKEIVRSNSCLIDSKPYTAISRFWSSSV